MSFVSPGGTGKASKYAKRLRSSSVKITIFIPASSFAYPVSGTCGGSCYPASSSLTSCLQGLSGSPHVVLPAVAFACLSC